MPTGLRSAILERVLLPASDVIRRRRYTERRNFLEQAQWWRAGELRAYQWREIQQLLQQAFDAPFYRRKYGAAGIRLEDIRSLDDFRNLPVLTREEVEVHREEMLPAGFHGRYHLHSTGGSSGRPVRFHRSVESYDWRTAATQRSYSWSGFHLGDRCLFLWGAPVGKESLRKRLRLRLARTVRGELHISTFSQDDALWERVRSAMKTFRPEFLSGYVSSLLNFCRFLDSNGIEDAPVHGVIAAAEPLLESGRAYLRKSSPCSRV